MTHTFIFFHPDYTVGFGISPNPDLNSFQVLRSCARGLYRQLGISPYPEDTNIQFRYIINLRHSLFKDAKEIRKFFGNPAITSENTSNVPVVR